MFSFNAKKPKTKPEQVVQPRNLAQMGFLDMGLGSQAELGDHDEGDDDDDLEAELAALTRGSHKKPARGKKKLVSERELDAMVSDSLKDLPSDAEISDIDDAEVEGELNELCEGSSDSEEEEPAKPATLSSGELLKTLEIRLQMYLEAEKAAKSSGDNSKARRFGRGVKTLQDLLKQAKLGRPITMDDVPPVLAPSSKIIIVKAPNNEPSASSTVSPNPNPPPGFQVETPKSAKVVTESRNEEPPNNRPIPPRITESKPIVDQIASSGILKVSNHEQQLQSDSVANAILRRNEYKQAALQAKRSGDAATALQHVRVVKVCDQLIATAQQGVTVDWSQLPGSPQVGSQEKTKANEVEANPAAEEPQQPSVEAEVPPTQTEASVIVPVSVSVPQPRNTMEALEQRLAKYKSSMEQAQTEGNSSKVRRMGRIVKQYQDAIKACKAGRPVAFDELPDPPGYPPIPGAPRKVEEEGVAAVSPEVSDATPAGVDNSAAAPAAATVKEGVAPPTAVAPAPHQKVGPKKSALSTRQDKQLAMLLERQTLFKQAALEHKKTGELELAKEYLRMAKGIDPLISANKCGVPVDMDTLPIPPQIKLASESRKAGTDDFEVLSSEECALVPSLGQNDNAFLVTLESDLVAQLKVCTDNRDHYKVMGDIANANRFDQLALSTRKDLSVVKSIAVRGDTIPRITNEIRTFSIVKCCTDLKDDDMEITILRGLSYNVPNPKTIDTYVKIEVPIPNSDNPFRDKTSQVKDTNNPEYNQTFHLNFSRQSRTLLRIFKGKSVKFEVYSKGGFLRSDVLIGTASVKLADLLNHCEFHTAVDLMDGRKPVGGKLEVKFRIRDPIIGKQVEQVQVKWTVLKSFQFE